MKPGVLILVLLSAVGCAVPPSIDGAPCPCPRNFHCDAVRAVCVGDAVAPDSGTGVPVVEPPGTDAGTETEPEPPIEACSVNGGVPVRLTPTEYRFTVADLLAVTLAPTELPPEHDGDTGFATASDRTDTEEGLRGLAKLVAERARPKLTRPASCPAGMGDEACGQLFINSFGVRAFRGPLTPAERSALETAFVLGSRAAAMNNADSLSGGMAAVVEAALGSNSFLRRREVAGPPTGSSKIAPLDAYSLAARLATTLWRSTPDETLLAAAQSQALLEPAEIERQAKRMLEDPRAERMLVTFFRDWLDVEDQALNDRAPALPAYSKDMRTAILHSFDSFAGDLVFRQDAPFERLFTSPTVSANRTMAEFYGLNPPAGADFEDVPPRDPTQVRSGLLTTPALLALWGDQLESHPVRRGIGIMQKLMCAGLPEPPPLVDIPAVPDPSVTITTRNRFENHRTIPTCASCHIAIDPFGFALENYDGLGRWRAVERTVPINSAGTMPGYNQIPSFTFTGPADLGQQLGAAPSARACYTRQWFRYVFGRNDLDADACTLKALGDAMAGGGQRTKALLIGLARSKAFTSANPNPESLPGK